MFFHTKENLEKHIMTKHSERWFCEIKHGSKLFYKYTSNHSYLMLSKCILKYNYERLWKIDKSLSHQIYFIHFFLSEMPTCAIVGCYNCYQKTKTRPDPEKHQSFQIPKSDPLRSKWLEKINKREPYTGYLIAKWTK